jgi:imidazole glycerol phosphate synthase subunit HisF
VGDGGVVKGIKFIELRDVKFPVGAAEAYYIIEGVSELVFLVSSK